MMSIAAKEQIAKERVFNVPNQLTVLRLVLSLALFVLIAFQYYLASFFVFVVAASTDWIDGYWARKYGQVTTLGRILDPFVDKIIVCGTFIFLGAVPGSGIAAWMAVLIVGRELLVTALRSFLEGEGADFSAVHVGQAEDAAAVRGGAGQPVCAYTMALLIRWRSSGRWWLACGPRW